MSVSIHTDTIRVPASLKRSGTVLLGVLAAGGLVALIIRFLQGLQVTGLTSNVPWGMWVVFYIYFIGLSAGSFLMSTIIYVFGMERFEKMGRMALVTALLALVGGMSFVWIDLGHPWRFWKVFFSWQSSSVLAWEALLYILYTVIILWELFLLMRSDLARLRDQSDGWRHRLYRALALGHQAGEAVRSKRTKNTLKALGIVGIPVAVGVHGGTGALFAVVAAKPHWFSGLFPIVFLVSALLSGAGLMLFLYSWFGRKDSSYAGIVDGLRGFVVAFVAIDVIMFGSDILVSLYGGIPDHIEVWRQIAFGEYWYVFWIGQISLAWVLPLVIGSLRATRQSALWLGAAGGSVVVGILAVRLNLIIPAYLFPQLAGLDEALPASRAAFSYFPSLIEWVSSLGVVAILVLLFMAGWKLLPINDSGDDLVKGQI